MRAHLRRYGLLYLIVFGGAALRLVGIGFAPSLHRARPDEELFIQQALFLFSGDLNPHWAANGWPELYFFLTHAALRVEALWLDLVHGGPVNLGCLYVVDPHHLSVAARMVACSFGVLTIPLTYVFARDVFRRFGERLAHAGALASAALLSVNVLHVRDSHFAVSDTTVVFFMTLGLWQLTRAMQPRRRRALYWTAIAFGVGAATKYTGLAMVGMLGVVAVARFFSGSIPGRRRALFDCVGVLVVFAVAFAAVSPHVLFAPDAYWSGLVSHQVRYSDGGSGWGYDAGRARLHGVTFHGAVSIPVAMGWPAALLALGGVVASMWRARGPAFVVAFFVLLFYGVVLGPSTILFMRYTQPLYPALSVLALVLPLELARRRDLDLGRLRPRLGAAAAVALALALPAYHSAHADLLMTRLDTRDLAHDWLVRHLEPGATVLSEGSFVALPTVDTEVIEACRELLPPALFRQPVPYGHQGAWRALAARGPAGFGPLARDFLVGSSDRGSVRASAYVVQTSPQLSCGRVLPYGRLSELPDCFIEVARFEPGHSDCDSVYDTFDMYMQPVIRPAGVERPGPVVVIYENRCGDGETALDPRADP